MAFFKRIMDHLLNQVLVETLANSKWFQRFAVWSHGTMKDLQSKSKAGSSTLDQQVDTFMKSAKVYTEKFRKDFGEELRKVQEQMKQEAARQQQLKK
mmetsp:Transcript_14104/g.30579  ORF Transcript_14104/g.30579 Transcript_14104/m.30579 type:complete len:97 (+) Transcript_14104:132-422(+)